MYMHQSHVYASKQCTHTHQSNTYTSKQCIVLLCLTNTHHVNSHSLQAQSSVQSVLLLTHFAPLSFAFLRNSQTSPGRLCFTNTHHVNSHSLQAQSSVLSCSSHILRHCLLHFFATDKRPLLVFVHECFTTTNILDNKNISTRNHKQSGKQSKGEREKLTHSHAHTHALHKHSVQCTSKQEPTY